MKKFLPLVLLLSINVVAHADESETMNSVINESSVVQDAPVVEQAAFTAAVEPVAAVETPVQEISVELNLEQPASQAEVVAVSVEVQSTTEQTVTPESEIVVAVEVIAEPVHIAVEPVVEEPTQVVAEQSIELVVLEQPQEVSVAQESIAVEMPAVEVQPEPVVIVIPPLVHSPSFAAIEDLEPRLLWEYFDAISQIPRGSYNEAAIAQFIIEQAAYYGCTARRDSVGNVIVQKPASDARYANTPIIVIQSHLDMVCEKHKNITHDFTKDPIRFVRKNNHLYADGTTLGADNGIGVAAALAIMKSTNIAHGPLEFLFTVVEEAGFDGAKNVTGDTIKGRMLINVDTEEEGSLYIGCAGSACVVASAEINREQLDSSYNYYSIVIDGLRGGHSGVDINQGRCNALQIASKLLKKMKAKGLDFRLISIDGGNKRNAIARDAEIILAVKKSDAAGFEKKTRLLKTGVHMDHKRQECRMSITFSPITCEKPAMSLANQEQIMKLMDAMPHGVIAISSLMQGLVQTSTNFASVKTHDACVVFETMQRSLIGAETDAAAQNVYTTCVNCGFNTTITDGSPEWQPNENSLLLKKAQFAYKFLFNQPLEVKAIHAGLECGAFVRQVPGLDAISFGPTIVDAHSPTEHIDVTTVDPFWKLLITLIGNIAREHITK